MQSVFPQFGGTTTGAHAGGNAPFVTFKAGKMTAEEKANGKFLISPEKKKGRISLVRGEDQLVHFQWRDRENGSVPDDFILFPEDAIFKKAETGREGDRVYILQYKGSSRRFFYWMQSKNGDKDEEHVKKLNDILNNPTPARMDNTDDNVAMNQNTLMQMMSGRRGQTGNINVQMQDLQNILQTMGFPPTSSSSTGPSTTSTSSSTSSSTPSTQAPANTSLEPSTENAEETEEELLQRALEESMRDQNEESTNSFHAAALASSSQTKPFSSSIPSGGSLTTADLQRAMQRINHQAQPRVVLMELLKADNIATFLEDPSVQQDLIPLLPEGLQTPEEIFALLHTPQFRQGVASLTSALQTSNFNTIMSNFGLDSQAGASKLITGNSIGAFLDAIQHWADSQNNI